jgi:hypothetical protein
MTDVRDRAHVPLWAGDVPLTGAALPRHHRETSEPPRRHHLLDDRGFVIDDEMGIALDHSERFVSKDVGDFKQ